MKVTFGFMSDTASYVATIPDNLTEPRELYSVVKLLDTKRSIQFGTVAPVGDHKKMSSLLGPDGAAEVFHRATEPAEDVAVWTVSGGQVWLCVDPAFDGSGTLAAIVKQLRVTDDGIAPRIRREGALSAPDVRDLHDRDCVSYLSDGSSVPYSVRFLLSGGAGGDSTVNGGSIAIVNRATRLGITVACDGPPSQLKQLEATAAAVAGSLATA